MFANDPGDALAEGPRRFHAFNGLRLLSAVLIVVYHAAGDGGTHLARQAGVGQLVSLLSVGVPVFFVLSGFLLYRPMVAARLTGAPQHSLGRYAWHRFRRVLPAYWLVLFIAAHLGQADLGRGADPWRFAGLLQIYHPELFFGGLVVAWSLCTELSFYAYLPVHNLAMRVSKGSPGKRVHDEWIVCGVLIAASIGFKVWLHRADPAVGNGTLPEYLDAFAVGMLLAVVSVSEEHRRRAGRLFTQVERLGAWSWVAAVAVFVALSRYHFPTGLDSVGVVEGVVRSEAYVVIAALLVAPLVVDRGATTPLGAVLGSPLLRRWGELSYGIFLIHLPLVTWLQDRMREPAQLLPTLWLAVVALAASSALAAVLYAAVEWPFRRFEIGGGRRRGPTARPGVPDLVTLRSDEGSPATLRSGADG